MVELVGLRGIQFWFGMSLFLECRSLKSVGVGEWEDFLSFIDRDRIDLDRIFVCACVFLSWHAIARVVASC